MSKNPSNLTPAHRKGQIRIGTTAHTNPFVYWGLTGGIAAGKSLAARFFKEAGLHVIDADALAKELSQEGGLAYPAIVSRFGTADRQELKEIIFNNPAAKKDLEAMLHPLIYAESLHRAKQFLDEHTDYPYPIIYEAALLVETNRFQTMAGLIVVDCPLEIRRARLIARDHLSAELAEKIIQTQASDEARRQAATYILSNAGTPGELRKQVQELIPRIGAHTQHSRHEAP